MGNTNKTFSLLLAAFLTFSSLMVLESATAQTLPKPEFSLKYIDNSYNVPPTTSPSIDPYTGDTTTETIYGYHVDRRTIEITIKNNGASHYNFRFKGYYGDQWNYYPFNPNDANGYSLHNTPRESPPFPASASDYTVAYLPSAYIPQKGLLDVQVQGLFGDFRKVHEGSIGAMMLGYNTTYNYYFEGEAGDWSNAQTVAISETSYSSSPSQTTTSQNPTPTPTLPEFPSWTIPLLLTITLALAGLLVYHKPKKPQIKKQIQLLNNPRTNRRLQLSKLLSARKPF
jgi:hypothetical protein